MSYAGVERDYEYVIEHCGSTKPHEKHTDWHYGGIYTVCTGQLPPPEEA